jgi:PPOX class probable FMN-dependent enzyme
LTPVCDRCDRKPAPWRHALEQALSTAGRAGRSAQLATAGADGVPHNRTVVFRGFLTDSDSLLFATDGRSAKAAQITSNPCGALCWYFPQPREQFRILGDLRLIGPSDESPAMAGARRAVWESLSPATRGQFFWPPPGSEKREHVSAPAQADCGARPACFCLILLAPRGVDHLRLSMRPHERRLYTLGPEGEWKHRDVNP